MVTLTVPDDSAFGLANLLYGVFSTPGTDPRWPPGSVSTSSTSPCCWATTSSPGRASTTSWPRVTTVGSEVRALLQERLAGDVPTEAVPRSPT